MRYAVPPDATDCHMHVFGPLDRYKPAAQSSYTPTPAPLEAWQQAAGAVGLQRLVIVQPSAYGMDNHCTLHAIRQAGPAARGIAMIDDATPDAALDTMHAAGIRGIRVNAKSMGMRDPSAIATVVARTAERIGRLGWHIQIYADLPVIAALAPAIAGCAVPVVLDHMGGARAGDSADALRPMLDLLSAGQCWVKLSGAYRVSRQDAGFTDSTPIAQALVRANPAHLVWGTDWPHTGSHGEHPRENAPTIQYRALNEAELLDLLAEAAGTEANFRRILTTNPARLYGW